VTCALATETSLDATSVYVVVTAGDRVTLVPVTLTPLMKCAVAFWVSQLSTVEPWTRT